MSAAGRVAGGLLGIALGEAAALPVARLAPAEASAAFERSGGGPLVHGAQTTWALSLVDALTDRPTRVSFAEELGLRLAALAQVHGGMALRGGPQTAAGTFRQVGAALQPAGQPLAAVDEARADGLASAIPLALVLGDREVDLIEALVTVVTLTHRHPEVLAGAGLLVGGFRAAFRQARGNRETILDEGMRFARRVLDNAFAGQPDLFSASRAAAEGAAAVAVATARHQPELGALCPIGLDTRDAPARVAVAALCALEQDARATTQLLEERCRAGGDADVLLPLVAAGLGVRDGVSGLPLGWLDRLATRPLVLTRARALLGGPRSRPLELDELRISRRWQSMDEPSLSIDDDEDREQLSLL